jgi:hypothetical protein
VNKKLYIYGASTFAKLARFYFELEKEYSFQKFIVDNKNYLPDDSNENECIFTSNFLNLGLDEDSFLFIAIGFSKLNKKPTLNTKSNLRL